jgi:phosphate transport system ATP-binding protein
MNQVISIKPSTMSDRDKPAVDPVAAPTPVTTMKPMAVPPPSAAATTGSPPQIAFDIQDLSIFYGSHQAIKNVSLQITAHSVTAIIGPSGCGKSTLLRSLNRMHELTPGARHTGSIRILGDDLYGPDIDPTVVRRRVGMIFQKSNPFPTLTIAENVLVGLRLNGVRDKVFLNRRLEESLRMAALWDEVKDHLHRPGTSLSGGQQQRLCIARAIANRPEILLMDEPCSALDPIATGKVEELIHELSRDYTIVIVTHNMQQAARVSNKTAFMYMGKLVEYGETEQIFMNPKDPQTEAYVSGRFG